jgi:tellurite resistance protein TehA-like permease
LHLRRLGLTSIVVLLAQSLLGMAVNLWVTIGPHSPWSHISHVALFAVHGIVGVALVLLTFLILAKAFEESSRRDKAAAATAFVGVIGAACCGVGFVSSGGASGFSFGMAVGWVVILAADLFLVLPATGTSRVTRSPEG